MHVVVKLQDDKSEGLSRRLIIEMVVTASNGKLNLEQAGRTWDRTIFPLGKKLGLLTGYVTPQAGTSKRTAAGDRELQRKWYDVVSAAIVRVTKHAYSVLQDWALVKKITPWLICNLDEECLNAMGKNNKIAGSKSKRKHDNQNASSR